MQRAPQPEASTRRKTKRGWLPLFVALLLFAAGLAMYWFNRPSTEPKDPAIAETWQPSRTPVLSLPGTMRVVYQDLGATIELSITAAANPIPFVDTNANHKVDAGDIAYAAANNRACVERLDTPDSTTCGKEATEATVHAAANAGEDLHTTVWRIPKREIGKGRDFADIVIQTFHEQTQTGEFFPQAGCPGKICFNKIYRLSFEDRGAAVHPTRPLPHSESPPEDTGALSAPAPQVSNPDTSALAAPKPQPTTPVIVAFDGTPASADPASGTRLHWQVHDATSVTISPQPGPVGSEGTATVPAEAKGPFVLTASNGPRTSTREITVARTPVPPPQLISFTASAPEVPAGASVHLAWHTEGPIDHLHIDPLGGDLPPSGARDVVVTQTTEYMLIAAGPGGSTGGRVVVRAKPLGPPSIAFEATPAAVLPGGAVTLHWDVSGADNISIDSGIGGVNASGTLVLHPAASIHYTLSATGRGGTSTRDLGIVVSRPDIPPRGRLVWSGVIAGTQLVTIDRNRADTGQLEGELPGQPCILQLSGDKNASIASAPGPRNDYTRLVLRLHGNGPTRIVIDWVLQ